MIIDLNGNAYLGRRRQGTIITRPKPSGGGASALLQHAVTSSGTTVAPSSTAAGSLIVVPIAISVNHTVTSVTDNQSNTYTPCSGAYKNATDGAGAATDIWYCNNATAGVTLITATPSSGGFTEPFMLEFSNPVLSSVLDTAAAVWNTGSSTTVSAGTVTTTNAKDIIVAIALNPATAGTLTSPGGITGFTQTDAVAGFVYAGYAIVSSTGTYTPTWQQASAGEGMGSTAAFKGN